MELAAVIYKTGYYTALTTFLIHGKLPETNVTEPRSLHMPVSPGASTGPYSSSAASDC